MNRASGAANNTIASSVSACIIPATGVCAPERMLVAVRAMAPVAGSPPKRGDMMLAMPWPTSSTLGLCFVAAHAVGNHGGHQRFNRAEHGDRDRGRDQRPQQIKAKLRNFDCRKAGGNAAEARPDGLAGSFNKTTQRRACKQRDDVSRHALHVAHEDQNHNQREACRARVFQRRERIKISRESFHARQKFAGDLFYFEAKEILDLRAGDKHRDAVRESNDNRSRNVLHRGAQPVDPQYDQQHARHQRAHEQAVQPVLRDDPVDDHDERARGSADLRGRSAQRGDQKPGDNRAINPACGGTPEAIAKAIASGNATSPTVTPAKASAQISASYNLLETKSIWETSLAWMRPGIRVPTLIIAGNEKACGLSSREVS